jgi:Holliday junction resolvasome RuvABC endonuclease subunit
MTTVIGIDPALSACGLAVWRDGRIVLATVTTTKAEQDPHGWDTAERHRRIVGAIAGYVERGHTVAAVERPIRYATHSSAADIHLAGLSAVIGYALRALHVPTARIGLEQVKGYATGKGNAGKREMVSAARRQLGVAAGDDNQADALWLAAMALEHYGAPLVTLPARQRAVADRVTWPLFPRISARKEPRTALPEIAKQVSKKKKEIEQWR